MNFNGDVSCSRRGLGRVECTGNPPAGLHRVLDLRPCSVNTYNSKLSEWQRLIIHRKILQDQVGTPPKDEPVLERVSENESGALKINCEIMHCRNRSVTTELNVRVRIAPGSGSNKSPDLQLHGRFDV